MAHQAQIELRQRVTVCRRLLKPHGRLSGVARDPLPLAHQAESELRGDFALRPGPLIPLTASETSCATPLPIGIHQA
jgi:hypothetical protein